MDGRIFFNLFAKTLEKILYSTLHKLISRYPCTYLGFVIFGMRVIKVWFMGLGIVTELSHERTEVVTS